MELLHKIKDKECPKDESTLEIREASRAVLFNENGLIPFLFVSNYNYHKLPGGGIDDGEDKAQALVCEVMEEVGSEIEVTDEVGKIIEYRSQFNLKQISYCYISKIISKGSPAFMEDELSQNISCFSDLAVVKFLLKWKGHFSLVFCPLSIRAVWQNEMRTRFCQNYFLGKGFSKTLGSSFLNSDVANGKGRVWGGIFHLLFFLF